MLKRFEDYAKQNWSNTEGSEALDLVTVFKGTPKKYPIMKIKKNSMKFKKINANVRNNMMNKISNF